MAPSPSPNLIIEKGNPFRIAFDASSKKDKKLMREGQKTGNIINRIISKY
jgi:hypothetical protein